MKVQGLNFSSYAAEDYIELNLFFSADHSRTAVIYYEIHIVNDLKASIIIETNILISEKIDILLSLKDHSRKLSKHSARFKYYYFTESNQLTSTIK